MMDTTNAPGRSCGLRHALMLLAAAAIATGGPLAAQKQTRPRPGGDDAKPKAKPLTLPGVDGPVRPLKPKTPDTAADRKRRDALAWYLTGQIRERRRDFRGAYDAYAKAVELDPKAVEAFRALVPLAFRLNRTSEAVGYATKAVELDPDDYQLARRLALFMASQRKIPEAVKLLELALGAKALDRKSAAFVAIHRDLGLLYQATGEKQKAADSYFVLFRARNAPKTFHLDEATQRRLDRDPISSYERMGQVFLDAERFDLAKKAFLAARKDVRGRPGNLNYNLATVHYKTKQYDKALAELQKYLDANASTKGRAAYQLLADILKAQHKSGELIGRLEAAAKKDPRNKSLQYYLAEQYVAADRLKDAETLYTKTMAGSKDLIALLGLATLYRKQKKTDKWIAAVEGVMKGAKDAGQLEQSLARLEDEFKAVGKDEDFVDALFVAGRKGASGKTPTLSFERSLILAQLASERKNTGAAKLFFRYALKRRADMAAVIYQQLASYLLLNDEYKDAADTLQEAVSNPALRRARPNFLFRLSQAQELAGRTDKALQAIREAQKLLPGVALLQYQEAWIYYHARQWDKAVPRFEQVIRNNPTNAEIVRRCKFSLSNIYVLQGHLRKGERILEEVYAAEPDNISVNNDLGYLWADQGKNLKQAEKMVRKAVKAEPDNPAYLDSLGWVLFKLGRYKEGLPHLKRAVKLPGGGDATIWDHLGDCYEKLGDHKQAVSCWKKGLEKAEKDRFQDQKLLKSLRTKLGAARPPVPAKAPRAK